MNAMWNYGYAPAEAERGKYVVVDPDALSTLGYPATGRGKYAMLVYNVNVGGEVVPPASAVTGGTLDVYSRTITASSFTVTAPTYYTQVEIYNNSASTAYVMASATTLDQVSAKGIPILQSSYYDLTRTVYSFTVGTLGVCDLRVMCYK